MRLKSLLLSSAFFMAFAWNASADPVNCDGFTHDMITKVLDIFHDKTHNLEQRRATLSGVFQQAVDTDWIGKFVLGRFWQSASDEEKKQYLALYRQYLTNNYISKLDDDDFASIQDIQVLSTKPTGDDANDVETKSLIKRVQDEDIHIDYLINNGGGTKCQVHNITVEGVSLLTTQRSEFQTLASQGGVKSIIEAMQRKITAESQMVKN